MACILLLRYLNQNIREKKYGVSWCCLLQLWACAANCPDTERHAIAEERTLTLPSFHWLVFEKSTAQGKVPEA